MSLSVTRVIELRSVNGAQVNSPYLGCAGSKVTAHVLLAPGDLVGLQGGTGNNPAEGDALMVQSVAGTSGNAAATGLTAGYYNVVDRPSWIRVVITTDGAGPRTSRVELRFDPEE